MKRKAIKIAMLLAAVGMALLSLSLMFTAVRRIQRPFVRAGGAVEVEGVITEKLVEQQTDRFLPFDVTTYIIRYTFPNAQGKMRTGEQIVTRRFYNRTGEQGAPIPVTLAAEDATINAVDTRSVFPGIAGWRLWMGTAGLIIAAGLGVAGWKFKIS